jgi:hypothetical protein
MQDILKFIVNFAEIQLPVGHIHKHRGHRVSPAAAAAAAENGATALQRAPSMHKAGRAAMHRQLSGKVLEGAAAGAAAEAAAVEIESQLHRQGLRNKAAKGAMPFSISTKLCLLER